VYERDKDRYIQKDRQTERERDERDKDRAIERDRETERERERSMRKKLLAQKFNQHIVISHKLLGIRGIAGMSIYHVQNGRKVTKANVRGDESDLAVLFIEVKWPT
jgi:hypothetical protein